MVLDLDKREREILGCLVELYTTSAHAVGSAAITKHLKKHKISAASVRAILVKLEKSGLLMQPHTSSGRIPTPLGWKIYLADFSAFKLRQSDKVFLDDIKADSPGEFISQLGLRLSDLSGQLAWVSAPRFVGTSIKKLGIIRFKPRNFFVFCETPNGFVQQKQVELRFDLDQTELNKVENFLNAKLTNRSLRDVYGIIEAEIHQDCNLCHNLLEAVTALSTQGLPVVETEITLQGRGKLAAQPEIAQSSELSGILRILENKMVLLEFINQLLISKEIQVRFGAEEHLAGTLGLSCVAGPWGQPTNPGPTGLGVIGPSRMPYSRLIPVVDYASQLLGKFWMTV